MFSKSQLDTYNNIKAPAELYEKVVNAKPKKNNLYIIPFVSTLAACLVLISGIYIFAKDSKPEIIFNGQELTSAVVFYDISPAMELDMRSSPVLSIPLELTLKEETTVTASHGKLCCEGYAPASALTLNDTASVLWEIQREEDFSPCKLTLEANGNTTVITLTQNEMDGSYSAEIN